MAEVEGPPVRIYEDSSLVATAHIPAKGADRFQEVTFKFLRDGEPFEEKTVAVASADSGSPAGPASDEASDDAAAKTVQCDVNAPLVDDQRDSYLLEYHVFYKVQQPNGNARTQQKLANQKFEVLPRTARLDVTWDADDKPFSNFAFKVQQDGCDETQVRSTFAKEGKNAQGETIPAGTAEFNLELVPGFRIVPDGPYEITEHVQTTGRKRAIKGDVKARARFVSPEKGSVQQWVNYDVEDLGQTGLGHEVTIEVALEADGTVSTSDLSEVHFRVTYGPEPGAAGGIEKSKRDDPDHPTTVFPVGDAAKTTIEEKEPNKKYEGKVEVDNGVAYFKVALGLAGGDTCKVEISGTRKFLSDEGGAPDETLEFENWRRLYYELLVPDILAERAGPKIEEAAKELETNGPKLFIGFVRGATQVFDTIEGADHGTLAPRRFLGLEEDPEEPAYILSGRNWRELPKGVSWKDEHPGKTLHIAVCDAILKWRQDTDDEQAGTHDFSGTVKEVTGTIDVEERFGGRFMPFSGHDAGDGITDVKWSADITKDDPVCKFTPELVIEEERPEEPVGTVLTVTLEPDSALPSLPARIPFRRPAYPDLKIANRTSRAPEGEQGDGSITVKEPNLCKEVTLQFEEPEQESSEEVGLHTAEDSDDWDWDLDFDDVEGVLAQEHADQLETFFLDLFASGKADLQNEEGTNPITIELIGSVGAANRTPILAEATAAVRNAHTQTHGRDHYDFDSQLTEEVGEHIQDFVDALLEYPGAIRTAEDKVTVTLRCSATTGHGEDDCFASVRDKLRECFDTTNSEVCSHPGLDSEQDNEPREGTCTLREMTGVEVSTSTTWHFALPTVTPDERIGPGSFVGPERSKRACPTIIEFSIQPHEASGGESDGFAMAWAHGGESSNRQWVRLVVGGFKNGDESGRVAHGHLETGAAADCLLNGQELCAKCIEHGRSLNPSRAG